MPLALAPSVARALRGRDAELRGAAVCMPPVAPAPRASLRRAARVVCIAAGLEGASDAGDTGRDEAWEAAQRAAADIRRRYPTTPSADNPPKKGATNAELNNRYVDGGLPRDAPLPLSLAYRFERLPQGDTTRIGAGKPCTISDSQSCSLTSQVQVWERTCSACNGSGFALSRSRRKSSFAATCMLCNGVGAVRCASTRPRTPDNSA